MLEEIHTIPCPRKDSGKLGTYQLRGEVNAFAVQLSTAVLAFRVIRILDAHGRGDGKPGHLSQGNGQARVQIEAPQVVPITLQIPIDGIPGRPGAKIKGSIPQSFGGIVEDDLRISSEEIDAVRIDCFQPVSAHFQAPCPPVLAQGEEGFSRAPRPIEEIPQKVLVNHPRARQVKFKLLLEPAGEILMLIHVELPKRFIRQAIGNVVGVQPGGAFPIRDNTVLKPFTKTPFGKVVPQKGCVAAGINGPEESVLVNDPVLAAHAGNGKEKARGSLGLDRPYQVGRCKYRNILDPERGSREVGRSPHIDESVGGLEMPWGGSSGTVDLTGRECAGTQPEPIWT